VNRENLRHEEIRGLFIFGLLAVLASIRIQYSSTNTQMTVQFGYGTINLLPILDNIILLWSLYAFFMVLGLSGDVIGKRVADSFRGVAKIFLQWNFIILGSLSIPFGFIAYGERFFYLILLIVLTVIVGTIFVILFRKPLHFQLRPIFTRRNLPFTLGLIFLFSSYVIVGYPEAWFASIQVTFVAYVVSAVTITILLFLEARKKDDTYTSDDDYYW
jgi:hypothetical protein